MLLPVVLLMAEIMQAGAASGMTPNLLLEPVISEAKYCREPSGDISLSLRFILHSQNLMKTPVILPMFAIVSRYELFNDEAALKLNRAASSRLFHRDHVLDATKLDNSAPDAKLFWILRSGETASAYHSVRVVVYPVDGGGHSLRRGDYLLRVQMNPWPAERKVGEKLRTLWQEHGVLWMSEIQSLPLKLHVEDRPRPDVCRSYVD